MMEYNNPNDPWMHQGYDPYKGMDEHEKVIAVLLQVISVVVSCIVGLLLCCLFSSCTTTQYVPVIEHKTDTVIVNKVKYDSIFVHDSTIVEKGDSIVTIERWHTKYINHEVHDTTYIARTDTVPQPYPVTEYVEKPLSTIEKVLIGVGLLSLMALIVWAAIKLRRFLP